MSTDRELLEFAAKAAGFEVNARAQAERDALIDPETASLWINEESTGWNPLRDDGHALRLAVKLGIGLEFVNGLLAITSTNRAHEDARDHGDDLATATRRAITRAAAAIAQGAAQEGKTNG